MKTLLILGAGREAIPALQHAKQLGYRLVVTDGNPRAPGFAYADDTITVSTYDVAVTVKLACHYDAYSQRIDGVLALAADVPQTVAAVAAALGLPGISPETARLTSDKVAMKLRLLEAKIPIPWFAALTSLEELRALVASWGGTPLVLKPVDSRGARGVLRLTRDVDLAWAWRHSRAQSPTERVMLEEYLEGPQISTETVLHDGWAETPAVVDRNYSRLNEFAPYIVEDGGSWPAALTTGQRAAVCDVAERAAQALGINNWTAKGDIVFTADGPKVIEMASRLSGGYMSSLQSPLATGVDLIGLAIRLATGEPVLQEDCLPRVQNAVAIRYVFAAPGLVRAVLGLHAVQAFPGVAFVDIPVETHDVMASITNHTHRAGCVITTGTTRDDAVLRAEWAVRNIHIDTEPLT